VGTGWISGGPRQIVGVGVGDGGRGVGDEEGVTVTVEGMKVGEGECVGLGVAEGGGSEGEMNGDGLALVQAANKSKDIMGIRKKRIFFLIVSESCQDVNHFIGRLHFVKGVL
jgi:hypothetical protein